MRATPPHPSRAPRPSYPSPSLCLLCNATQTGPPLVFRLDQLGQSTGAAASAAGGAYASTIAPDSVNKVFLGGLPTSLPDAQIVQLVEVRACVCICVCETGRRGEGGRVLAAY